jgi:hypothetical protein
VQRPSPIQSPVAQDQVRSARRMEVRASLITASLLIQPLAAAASTIAYSPETL